MKLIHTCMAFAIALSLGGAHAATAQQTQQPADHSRAKAPDPVTGEIVSVNTANKTIVVKTGPESELKFAYNEQTEIVGGEKGPEGLATSAGTMVTVTYDVHGTANVAIKIEIKPKQQ